MSWFRNGMLIVSSILYLAGPAAAEFGDLNLDGVWDQEDVLELMDLYRHGLPLEAPLDYANVAPYDLANGRPVDDIVDVDEADLMILLRGLRHPDLDGDGLPPWFESLTGTNPFLRSTDGVTNDGDFDTDLDGLVNRDELLNGTAYDVWDTDGDFLGDGWEIAYGFDPSAVDDWTVDSDLDGVQNWLESQWNLDPNSGDSDGDGLDDFYEIQQGTRPDVADDQGDADQDGLTNLAEYLAGLDAGDQDTDGDGIHDYTDHVYAATCAHVGPGYNNPNASTDSDGLTSAQESLIRTNPCDPDTDGDGEPDDTDNCAITPGAQDDTDTDGIGNVCDTCPHTPDPNQIVGDDGTGVACLCGDVTNDGAVDGADLSLLLYFFYDRSQEPASFEKCDVDRDGICGPEDAAALDAYLNASGPAPLDGCADFRRIEQHVLDRMGYGWDPASLDALKIYRAAYGVEGYAHLQAYVDDQVVPHTVSTDEGLGADMSRVDGRFGVVPDRYVQSLIYGAYLTEEGTPLPGQYPVQQGMRRENQEWRIIRATYSDHQLQTVLEDFWYNHFSANAKNGAATHKVPKYVREAIRANMYGRMEDMVIAIAQHPLMLDYLNLQQNRKYKENENFAREVMELHTLGVDGGYDDVTVQGLTTLLTGWYWTHNYYWWADKDGDGQVDADEYYCRHGDANGAPFTPAWVTTNFPSKPRCEDYPDPYFLLPGEPGHNASQHDGTEITLLIQHTQPEDPHLALAGLSVNPDAGELLGNCDPQGQNCAQSHYTLRFGDAVTDTTGADGEEFLRFASRAPATARRTSTKLAVRFVDEDPRPELIDAMTAKWLETDGNLAAVMQVMFESSDFLGFENIRGKVKRPHVLQSSAFRALGEGAEGQDVSYSISSGTWVTLRFPYNPSETSASAVAEPDPRQDLVTQGENLFGVHPPSGLPDTSVFWGNGVGRYLSQANMVLRAATDRFYTTAPGYQWDQIPSTTVAERDVLVAKIAEILIPGGIGSNTQAVAEAHAVELYDAGLRDEDLNAEIAALLLSSPEFRLH